MTCLSKRSFSRPAAGFHLFASSGSREATKLTQQIGSTERRERRERALYTNEAAGLSRPSLPNPHPTAAEKKKHKKRREEEEEEGEEEKS
jgi:hypothetical protein